MNESLEELYFNWLHAKIMLSEPPAFTYDQLLRRLYDTEFVWLVEGDDNRAENGKILRVEFIQQSNLDIDKSWFYVGCSILEMLIYFVRDAEFQTEMTQREWFWLLLSNLGLSEFHDGRFNSDAVDNQLYTFVWRTYAYSGEGGLFPLTTPPHDQRKVEIWYQFCEYLIDRDIV